MKTCFITFLIILCISSQNFADAQSQTEMNMKAYADYQKVDKQLGVVYQKVIKEYASDNDFIEALRASERLWIQFRDAELKMKFPAEDTRYYGSMYPMCSSGYLEELTATRINELKKWLTGEPESGACPGSIKSKN